MHTGTAKVLQDDNIQCEDEITDVFLSYNYIPETDDFRMLWEDLRPYKSLCVNIQHALEAINGPDSLYGALQQLSAPKTRQLPPQVVAEEVEDSPKGSLFSEDLFASQVYESGDSSRGFAVEDRKYTSLDSCNIDPTRLSRNATDNDKTQSMPHHTFLSELSSLHGSEQSLSKESVKFDSSSPDMCSKSSLIHSSAGCLNHASSIGTKFKSTSTNQFISTSDVDGYMEILQELVATEQVRTMCFPPEFMQWVIRQWQ